MSDYQNEMGQDMRNYAVRDEKTLQDGLKGKTLNLENFSSGLFLAFYKDDPDGHAFGLFGPEIDIVKALAFFELKIPKKLRKARDEVIKEFAVFQKTMVQ